jgi:CheY-like chemotaxis protein/tRNA A-37 threonylcarbamoyl transferase component Bud32
MAKILIVEDDRDLCEQVCLWLDSEAYEVEAVHDGLAGSTRLAQADYDLVMLDWDLPGRSGVELCRLYRQQGGMAAVLILTGKGEINEKEEGLDAGADDYLTKPFDLVELSARVRALLRRQERSKRMAQAKEPPKIIEVKVCPGCGASFPKEANECDACRCALRLRVVDQNIGTTIGERYELLSVIARGGTASVYLGRQKLIKRAVAVKVLHADNFKDERQRKRFAREAEAVGRLDHAHIAAVHDFGLAEDGRPFLVMTYIDGQSLYEMLLENVTLDWRRAVRLFGQICDALVHAHAKGVVHRDLKPANVMVERPGEPAEAIRLVDFGIARLRPVNDDEIEKLTQDGEFFGTVYYMSPEQCLGQEPDERSDIYSLGCIMYEVLTGLPPIRGKNALDTIQAHLSANVLPCREARPDFALPEWLDAAVMRCLAKQPVGRYQSCRDLLSDLSR